jgi:hypothetical protein
MTIIAGEANSGKQKMNSSGGFAFSMSVNSDRTGGHEAPGCRCFGPLPTGTARRYGHTGRTTDKA